MKKFVKKEGGVSEVLGSILILLITVVLFSSVFYYVSTIPTPKSHVYAQFDAHLELVNVTENGESHLYANITVKNIGGESLDDWRTMFIVVIDFTAKQHMLSEGKIASQPFDKDGKFSQGESFYYNSSWDNLEVTPYSDISITLFDKSNGKVIWSAKLRGRANMPPVLISFISSPSPIVLNKRATLKATVFDPDNPEDVGNYKVGVDLSTLSNAITTQENPTITNPSYVPLHYSGKSIFVSPSIYFKDIASLDLRKPYKVMVWIDDNRGNNISYPAYLFLSRGTGITGPDLYIDPTLIMLSTTNPTHMDDVTVSVTVQNFGGTGASFKLRVYDIYPGYEGKHGYTTDSIFISTNFGSSSELPSSTKNYTVAAAGQTTISFIWKNVGTDDQGNNFAHIAGTHQLRFEIIDISPEEDPNAKYPDQTIINITVMPRILLVDDDHAPEGSPYDTGRYYRYILDTCSYSYDMKKGEGGISRDVLEEYDIVLWETGYNTDPISPGQAAALNQFYDDGGALWLSSQGITQDRLTQILGTSTNIFKDTRSLAIKGIPNTPIDLTLNNGSQVSDILINRDNAENGNQTVTFNTIPSGYHPFITDNRSSTVGIYSTNNNGGKIVYTGFELSRVKHYYNQNFIAYRILKWLGNLSGRTGNDLAIEDMLIEPREPLYKEPVKITVVVSNNGGSPISSEVLLKVDGVTSLDINTTNPNGTGTIPPNGGFVYVNFTWIPSVPGKHVLTAMVDPYNVIKETNEENNIVNSEIIDTEVYVHFSTLVVYNSTSITTEAQNIISTLDSLGYKYTVLNLHNGAPSGYSDGSYFSRYNLVIWANTQIGKRDANAIVSSMTNYPNTGHFFMGTQITQEIAGSSTLRDFLGVTINSLTLSSPSVVFGVNNEESVTNGLAFIVNQVNTFTISGSEAQALFRGALPTTTDYSTLEESYATYSDELPEEGIGIASLSPSKFMILPIDLENVDGIFGLKNSTIALPYPGSYALQARAQLLYRLFKFFGHQDLMPELATYPSDIQIIYGGDNPELPPLVGRSYMLRTTIYNYGSVGTTAIVRFYDDFEWLGSQSVYLPPANVTNDNIVLPSTAKIEIVWTPMFAGHWRHIRVIVDPLNEVKETLWNGTTKEILNFNNEAIITKTVYYFWDNMEHGDENWDHEATVMNINGESPLDFLNRRDVSTKVIGDWDWSLSGSSSNDDSSFLQDVNVFDTNDTRVAEFTANAHHSAPHAFWMPETPRVTGKRKPIDLILVIDTSGSMGWDDGTGTGNTRLDDAKAAAKEAVGLLREGDQIAIFAFNGNRDSGPKQILPFTPTDTKSERQAINDTIDGLTANGGTPLFDTIAVAVEYMDSSARPDSVKGLIILTDGVSNSDDDYETYAPGEGNGDEPDEPGPVWNYTPQGDGLCNIPYNVFTVSIGDEPDARLHAISATSTAKIHYGVYTSDASKLTELFRMFVESLVQASTGGIRATPPVPGRSENFGATTVQDVPFVIFADGFLTGKYYNEIPQWYAPGYGEWLQHTYWEPDSDTITVTTGGNHIDGEYKELLYASPPSNKKADLEIEVYPLSTLSNLPGTYTTVKYRVTYLASVQSGHLYFQVSADGITWQTISTTALGPIPSWWYTNPGAYYMGDFDNPAGGNNPFYIRFVTDSGSEVYLDDIIVTAVVDYTPPSSSAGGYVPPGYSSNINMQLNYSYFITPQINITQARKAILSFWTKYWMTEGTNGGIMYLWGSDDGKTWTWDQDHRYYLTPIQSYTGNLDPKYLNPNNPDNVISSGGPVINGQQTGMADATYTGSGIKGLPYWCFNGRSGNGAFTWEYVEVDLTPYISHFKAIRIVFMLVQWGGLTPDLGWDPAMGWYLDDIKVEITSDGVHDLWHLQRFAGNPGALAAHSGHYAWVYRDKNGDLPEGIDSSLITKQIDLSTARSARLLFWIRFNLNPAAGVPPATVRVEVSSDNGMTWQSITYGVRIGWGSSGYGGLSGIPDNGNANHYDWVRSTTLVRINCDLSGWAGQSILIRFRVVTNATINPETDNPYPTWDPEHPGDPHGVFIDDVVVYGEGYAELINTSQDYYLWEGGLGLASQNNEELSHQTTGVSNNLANTQSNDSGKVAKKEISPGMFIMYYPSVHLDIGEPRNPVNLWGTYTKEDFAAEAIWKMRIW